MVNTLIEQVGINRNILCLSLLVKIGNEDNLPKGSLHLAADSVS